MSSPGVAIIPGNGGGEIFSEAMWYSWVYNKIRTELPDVEIAMKDMPDPFIARESIWIPFMRDELKIGENSIIVGHSSGAEAAIRFAERYKVRGIVLVSAYTTDMGIENEKQAEYFDRPWEWDKTKNNTEWIVQFGSEDDPFLDWKEQEEVAEKLGTEFHQFKDRGHFCTGNFPELVKVLKEKLAK